jgi:hypothetical protein
MSHGLVDMTRTIQSLENRSCTIDFSLASIELIRDEQVSC